MWTLNIERWSLKQALILQCWMVHFGVRIHIFYHASYVGIWISKRWIWDHADRILLKANVGGEGQIVFQIRISAWLQELMNTPENTGLNDQKNKCNQHTEFPWTTLEVCLILWLCLTSNRDIKICPFLWYSDHRHQGVYIIMLILFHLQHTIQLKQVLKMICVYIYIDRLHI